MLSCNCPAEQNKKIKQPKLVCLLVCFRGVSGTFLLVRLGDQMANNFKHILLIYLFIFKQALTDSVPIHFYYMEMSEQSRYSSKRSPFVHKRKKVFWVWNDMGMNKWSQYFHFCMSYTFNTVFSHLCHTLSIKLPVPLIHLNIYFLMNTAYFIKLT